MNKVEIKLNLNEDGSLKIQNLFNKEGEIILESKKWELNAKSVYELLNYSEENKYSVKSNEDETKNLKENDIFLGVVKLFKDITEEINKYNENSNQ